MIFNSFEFLVFLLIVLVLYWGVLGRTVRGQNLLLLVVSYIFYGWWDWRFLSLLFLSSMIDFLIALGLQRSQQTTLRRGLLMVSLVTNLGLLGFFKYFNFFADSLIRAFATMGYEVDAFTLQVILPVGISFYTFQTLSYTLDVYRRQMDAVRDPVQFLAYVSFFPQLVAGPIERAIDLLPQFSTPRRVNWPEIQEGCRQVLWGLFKKVVIADGVAGQVDFIFRHAAELDGMSLVIGACFFAIQIYGDFSGYTDIAIGTSRLMGFQLHQNFAYPYFSRNIAEFWRRWHITLSSWFRDYLYIPLGGSRVSRARTILNILLTFTLCGLWHGANWTFVAWGFLNGLLFVPLILSNRHHVDRTIVAANRRWPTWSEVLGMIGTQTFVLVSWILFRSESLPHASTYFTRMITVPWLPVDHSRYATGLCLCVGLILWEWFQRRQSFGLQIGHWPLFFRYATYVLMITAMIELGNRDQVPFLYFQF